MIDDTEHQNIGIVERDKSHQIYRLTRDQQVAWKKRIQPVIDHWIKTTPDGENVLAAFRKEIAVIRAGS